MDKKDRRIYTTWWAMINRCYDKDNPMYKYYGLRGIRVCKRWKNSFNNFFEDMGPKPVGLSLDRINNNKGYHKNNCRWATSSEQMRNCRVNKTIGQYSKSGKLLKIFNSIVEAAEATGIHRTSISHIVNGRLHHKSAGGFVWKQYKK